MREDVEDGLHYATSATASVVLFCLAASGAVSVEERMRSDVF